MGTVSAYRAEAFLLLDFARSLLTNPEGPVIVHAPVKQRLFIASVAKGANAARKRPSGNGAKDMNGA